MGKRMGKRRGGTGSFVQVFSYMMRTAAWKDLSPTERALYVEVKARYNGKNNGALAYSARDAGADLGVSKSAASRYFQELESHGFIVREKLSSFHQKRLVVEWRLTELRNDITGEPPSKEFTRWSKGEPSKAGSQKQKPVPQADSTGQSAGLEPITPPERQAGSPPIGPANIKLPISQSHERAASTILPEGTGINITAEVASPLQTNADTRARSSHNSPAVQPPSVEAGPYAGTTVVALVEDTHLHPQEQPPLDVRMRDPLVMAIDAAFPGAKLLSEDIAHVAPEAYAEELGQWEREAMDDDLLDVVPHGYEREFWCELS